MASRASLVSLLLTICLLHSAAGDIYLHYPRGSNNRLYEKTATRTNPNRLFDSQNNNRGGYNKGNDDFEEEYMYSSSGSSQSPVPVEWTMQHGCRDGRARCRVVIQAMCQNADVTSSQAHYLRNGQTTDTHLFTGPASGKGPTESYAEFESRRKNAFNVSSARGLHEPFEWYEACASRERNKGLNNFDQNLKGITAVYTRQNSGGTRRGLECPEERDYYPYWHPTPWIDLAVLTDDPKGQCEALQREAKSLKHLCVFSFPTKQRRWFVAENNEFDCNKKNGTFKSFAPYLEVAANINSEAACSAKGYIWGIAYRDDLVTLNSVCLVPLPKPECLQAPWSRDNHLGDKEGGGPSNFLWQPPAFPSKEEKRCVLRVRYNLTSHDAADIKNNPQVHPGLQLAINTAQVGRVFQDRSHVFRLKPRPDKWGSARLHHVGVRGKRGNIVQVYPAVEYDFTPTRLTAKVGDLLLLQWTGSDTHNNNSPGGDGATGSDGSGNAGTDRHNLLEIASPGDNFPLPFESSTFFKSDTIECLTCSAIETAEDIALQFASSGYYQCVENARCGAESGQTMAPLDGDLNLAKASFRARVFRLKKAGTYHFVNTRNNNFSNRSNKFSLTVSL